MALWLDELAAYAVAGGLGTLGTNLFRFSLQESPDAQVALIPYGGLPSEKTFGSDEIKWEFPSCQVLSRAAKGDRRAAYQKAEDAYRLFATIEAETLSGTFWHLCLPKQPPFWLGEDAQERPQFAFNLQIEKERSA